MDWKRCWLFIVAAATLIAATCEVRHAPSPGTERPNKAVIGYYASWKKAEFPHTLIAYKYLTHIAHAFAWPDPQGNLVIPQGYSYPELLQTAHANGVKVLLSLGGWGNCAGFPGAVSTAENRARFVGQLVDYCRAHGYDGVDLDWEFVSNDTEKFNFSLFVEALAAAFRSGSPRLSLTMAAPSGDYWGRWIDYERVSASFDYISFMTYDFHGAWSDHSGHNSPLYGCGDPCGSFDDTFQCARGRGVPLDKLVLGLAFFGRSFDCGGFGRPFTTSEYYAYVDAMALPDTDWDLLWDGCAQVPYKLRKDGGKILSFDDARSVSLKCQYVKDVGAAGLIIWELSHDYRNGKAELLEVVGKSFGVK